MSPTQSSRRIDYAGSVHDDREIEAVVAVLRGGPTALRIGHNVKAMEARVAELFGKRRGVMCNSGRRPSTWPSRCSTRSPATRSSRRR